MIKRVSNANFLNSLVGTLNSREHFWTTLFVTNQAKNDRRDHYGTKIYSDTVQESANIETLRQAVFGVHKP